MRAMSRPERPFSLALLLVALGGCGGEAQPVPAAPAAPAPIAETTPPLAPVVPPAPAPAPAPPEPVSKLSLQVFTGTPEGFLVTSTLIAGEKNALLIDAAFTLADAKKIADSVKASGKDLTLVYVTHFHPDHYFGFPAILEVFPNAKLVALPSTVAEVKKTWAAKVKQWKPMYKGAITSKPVIPEPLPASVLGLEGEKLEIVGDVQGDAETSSYVWIPTLRTVVCGDIVYDGVFPWTAETTPEQRSAWLGTLEKVAALGAKTVVPGHEQPNAKHDASSIAFTKGYLVAFDEALAASKNADELQTALKAKYPDAALDVILKIGAEAAFKKPKK